MESVPHKGKVSGAGLSLREAVVQGSNPAMLAIYSSDKRYVRLAGRAVVLSSYGTIAI